MGRARFQLSQLPRAGLNNSVISVGQVHQFTSDRRVAGDDGQSKSVKLNREHEFQLKGLIKNWQKFVNECLLPTLPI